MALRLMEADATYSGSLALKIHPFSPLSAQNINSRLVSLSNHFFFA
jgi:hypothetical protein